MQKLRKKWLSVQIRAMQGLGTELWGLCNDGDDDDDNEDDRDDDDDDDDA